MRLDRKQRQQRNAAFGIKSAIIRSSEAAIAKGMLPVRSDIRSPVSDAPRAIVPGGMTTSVKGSKVDGKVKAKREKRHGDKARLSHWDGKPEATKAEERHQLETQRIWRAMYGVADK